MKIYHGISERRKTDPLNYTRVIDHADLSCVGIDIPSHYLDCVPSDQRLVNTIIWTKSGGRQRFPVRVDIATIDDEDIYVYRLYFGYNSYVTYNDYGKYTCKLLAIGESLSINVTGGNY